MNFIVPPGGLRGFSQMTPASQRALFPGGGSTGVSRRRKSKKAKKATRGARRAKGKGGRKIKFGSPAWRKKYKLGRKKK